MIFRMGGAASACGCREEASNQVTEAEPDSMARSTGRIHPASRSQTKGKPIGRRSQYLRRRTQCFCMTTKRPGIQDSRSQGADGTALTVQKVLWMPVAHSMYPSRDSQTPRWVLRAEGKDESSFRCWSRQTKNSQEAQKILRELHAACEYPGGSRLLALLQMPRPSFLGRLVCARPIRLIPIHDFNRDLFAVRSTELQLFGL